MIRPSRMGWIVGGILAAVLVGLLVPAINLAREAARRTQSRNTLRQIGLALHNYHDTHTVLPPGGVFNADGVAFHGWTTSIAPYVDSSWFYSSVDFQIPWDDPRQVDLFRQGYYKHFYRNPSVVMKERPDGLTPNYYAANQTAMYRNSSESLQHWDSTAERLLVADALDHHLPIGCPYGWRDVTLALGTNPDGFGCRPRPFTQCLMGDGSVRDVNNSVASRVLEAMAGPVDQRPTAEDVQRIVEYPPLDVSRIWRVEFIYPPGIEKERPTARWTSPDGRTIITARRVSDAAANSGD